MYTSSGTAQAKWHSLTLLAERRKPSGELPLNTAKPEGSRPFATKAHSKMSTVRRKSSGTSM